MNKQPKQSRWAIKFAGMAMMALLMGASAIAMGQGFSGQSSFKVEAVDRAPGDTQGWGGAQGAISRADGAGDAGPLPADQAFALHVSRGDGGDVVNLVPAQGYLIYRHTIELIDGQGQAIEAVWPQGEGYEDGEFGQVQVFSRPVRMGLPDGQRLAVLQMQGCQANGICYPPMRAAVGADGSTMGWQTVTGQAAGPSGPQGPGPAGGDGGAGGQIDAAGGSAGQGGWLASLMSGPAGLAGFVLIGVLMAFSPCLLPMLPVTVSLVAGRAHQGRWAMAPVAWFTLAHAAVWAVGGFVAAGSGGVLLSAQLQSPALLATGAALFMGLGAWQMGWIQVRLPQWTGMAPKWREDGMGPMGAMAMGATSALVLGPCAAPLLAGALLAVAQAGDPWMGAVGLGLMGIGVCVPMLALAAGGSGLIARMRQASAWIAWIGASALWAVAMVLASRIVDPALWPWLVALWAAMAMAGLWSQVAPTGRARMGFAMALGAVLLAGAGSGISGQGMWALPGSGKAAEGARDIVMHDVKAGEIDAWVAGTGGDGIVWVVADWCSVCKKFERQTLADARVAGRLDNMNIARVDITAMGAGEMALLKDLGLVGPPGLLFYRQGQEVPGARLVGFEGADAFLERLGRSDIEG